MVHVEVLLVLVVDVDLELGDFIFCFGGDDEVVGGQDFEILAFVVILVLDVQGYFNLS